MLVHTLTVWSCDVEVGDVNYPHQEKPLTERERESGGGGCQYLIVSIETCSKQAKRRPQCLLVVEGLDEFGASGDESFGWRQEGT